MLRYPTASAAARVRAGAGERIEHDPAPERKHPVHQLPHERLRLEAGMRRQEPLLFSRRGRANDVPERPLRATDAENRRSATSEDCPARALPAAFGKSATVPTWSAA